MLNGYAYCRMLFEAGEPRDFIYLNVNRAFETLTGLRDVIGKKVSEVIPGLRESDPELFEIYGRVATTGIPAQFETYVEALGMWFSISVYSPRKEHFVAVFDVITERKEAEEKIRKSEEKYRHIIEYSPASIYEIDFSTNRFKTVNEGMCRMLGYSEDELLAMNPDGPLRQRKQGNIHRQDQTSPGRRDSSRPDRVHGEEERWKYYMGYTPHQVQICRWKDSRSLRRCPRHHRAQADGGRASQIT